MADALILEFDGFGREHYDAVNATLGLAAAGAGDDGWPEGLIFHSGAGKPGGWLVFEIWESKDAQERFMHERLGPALHSAGLDGPPARVEWLELARYVSPA
jgi:hypothetical protein